MSFFTIGMSHSKVVATGIVCLAIVGSVIIYNKKDYLFSKNSQIAEITQTNVISSSPQTSISDDWRKTLANISVATNSPIQIIASQNSGIDSGSDNTLTNQISKQFFALYLQDKKNGVIIDKNEATKIASQVVNNINLTSSAKKYGIKDIKVNQDISKTEKDKYAKALIDASNGKLTKGVGGELGIVSAAVLNQNETDLAKLDPIIKGYGEIIKNTLVIAVPIDNIGNHLVYLNTLSSILYDIQGMRKIFSDPMTGYITFSSYQKNIIKFAIVMENMSKYFAR